MENKILKPFDLQDALTGKAVMLRNGVKAYVRHHETELSTEIGQALLGYQEVFGLWSWCADGASRSTGGESPSDIIGMYPETRTINGFEVPAPETEELEYGARYYRASPEAESFHSYVVWDDHNMDKLWLERGLAFLSEEDAIANAKAMLGIDPNSVDES